MTTDSDTVELYPLFQRGKEVTALIHGAPKTTVFSFFVGNMSDVRFPTWNEELKSYTIYKMSGTLDYTGRYVTFTPNQTAVSELSGFDSKTMQEYMLMLLHNESSAASVLPKGRIEFMDDEYIRFHYTHGPLIDRTEIIYISSLLNSARERSKYRKYKALLRQARDEGSLVVPMIDNDKDVISLAIMWGRLLDHGSLPQDFN